MNTIKSHNFKCPKTPNQVKLFKKKKLNETKNFRLCIEDNDNVLSSDKIEQDEVFGSNTLRMRFEHLLNIEWALNFL